MFVVTNIRSDDPEGIALVQAFLSANVDPGVRERPAAAVERAIAAGQGLVVRLDGVVCGCSLVYKYPDPDDEKVYSEIGTMRITANGFDLQTFIAKLHLFQIRLEADEGDAAVFAVVSPGTASEHNLARKVLMMPWQVPGDLKALRASGGTPFSSGKPVLKAETESFSRARLDLKAWHRGGLVFETPKRGGRLEVAMGWFQPELLDVEV